MLHIDFLVTLNCVSNKIISGQAGLSAVPAVLLSGFCGVVG